MANISITRRCRRRCSYCFAKHERLSPSVRDMTPEVFEKALSFIKRSHIPEARLLGGEPTEHPSFREYVLRAVEEGLRVVVFSSGLVPDKLIDFLETFAADRLFVILNSADPSSDSTELIERQHRVCRLLGGAIRLGVNFRSFDQNANHLLDWIDRYQLQPIIRVGIAHPIWGGDNSFFRLKRRQTLYMVEQLFEAARDANIEIGLDCGFTPCLFSEAFVEAHRNSFEVKPSMQKTHPQVAESNSPLKSKGGRCGPVIDILPEGTCIACYALSRIARLQLRQEDNREDMMLRFENEIKAKTPPGIYRECEPCSYRRDGMCDGGCRARRALRFRPDLMPVAPLDFRNNIERISQ